MKVIQEESDIEKLAAHLHQSWSDIVQSTLNKINPYLDTSYYLSREIELINTTYDELSEEEKNKDREQAKIILDLLDN